MNSINRNNIYTRLHMLLALVAAAATLAGCASDEAEAGPREENQWLYPYGASTTDRTMQTAFYEANGVYLLFCDTLRKEQTGVSPDGTPFYSYEAVELQYNMTGNNNGEEQVFVFDYLATDADKQSAMGFVQNSVLPHLGGNLKPFSLLLVDKINYYVSNASTGYEMMLTNPAVYAGSRCTAIATEGVSGMTAAEQEAYSRSILKAIINGKLSALSSSTFDDFYSFCAPYYDTYAMDEEAEAFFLQYPTSYDIGLLENGYWSYGSSYGFAMYNIKSKEYDLEDYTNAVFDYTEAEFTEKYGNYPIVMEKYRILKDIFSSLGLVL